MEDEGNLRKSLALKPLADLSNLSLSSQLDMSGAVPRIRHFPPLDAMTGHEWHLAQMKTWCECGDVQTGQCQYTLKGHSSQVNSVVFSPDGSRVASSSYDNM
jgi:WD40 repeat protein